MTRTAAQAAREHRDLATEMLAMLQRIKDEIPRLDWTGMGCCPFCDWVPMSQAAPPCSLDALIAKASAALEAGSLALQARQEGPEREKDLGAVSATAVDAGPCLVPKAQRPHVGHDLRDLPQWNMVHEMFDALGIPTGTISSLQRRLNVSAATAMRLQSLYSAVEAVRHTLIGCGSVTNERSESSASLPSAAQESSSPPIPPVDEARTCATCRDWAGGRLALHGECTSVVNEVCCGLRVRREFGCVYHTALSALLSEATASPQPRRRLPQTLLIEAAAVITTLRREADALDTQSGVPCQSENAWHARDYRRWATLMDDLIAEATTSAVTRWSHAKDCASRFGGSGEVPIPGRCDCGAEGERCGRDLGDGFACVLWKGHEVGCCGQREGAALLPADPSAAVTTEALPNGGDQK